MGKRKEKTDINLQENNKVWSLRFIHDSLSATIVRSSSGHFEDRRVFLSPQEKRVLSPAESELNHHRSVINPICVSFSRYGRNALQYTSDTLC